MKKLTLALSATLALSMASNLAAQTNDITFVVAPSAGYTFWNKNLNLGESPFWGVRAGFAVGPIFEIRGVYERSFDLKGKLQGSSWSAISSLGAGLQGSTADISRIGGELKVNLWSNAILTPYLTAGAGVMNLEYDDPALPNGYKEEQLYGVLGAGLKINLAKRIALSLEAKNHLFNIDQNNRYLVPGTSSSKTLQNWGGQASLDFYLGGPKASRDKVSKAYREYFGDGFRGLKFVLEPGLAYINFHKDSYFNDTYLLGGSAGVDFNDYIGVRGFYYQGTKNPQKLDLNFGKELEIYGGNLLTRLNVSRGVTPYLTLGAGYLKVADTYVDSQGTNNAESGWFALGGAGLEIPLHRTVALYGQVNAMLAQQDNDALNQASNPSNVKANWAFQAGLRFNVGARSRSGQKAYYAYAEEQVLNERQINNEAINSLRAGYDQRIDSLNLELNRAAAALDSLEVARLAAEKRALKTEQLLVVSEASAETSALSRIEEPKTITLTKSQLAELVARVKSDNAPKSNESIERLLLLSLIAKQNPQLVQTIDPSLVSQLNQAPKATNNDEILRRLQQMEERIDRKIELSEEKTQRQLLNTKPQGVQIIELTEGQSKNGQTQTESIIVHNVDATQGEVETESYDVKDSFLTFRNVDIFAGLGFGEGTSVNLGVRPQWQMGKSRFYLAPDAYIGFGKETAYGLSGNVLYKFSSIQDKFTPYAGAGLGFSRAGGSNHFGVTAIVGASLNRVLGGKLFVDYSLRPVFKQHQLAAGYTLTF